MAKKILIVDDEPNIVRMVENRLKVSGYTVLCAENGVVGIEKASAEKPDAILLDVLMPEMDGFETLKKLKAQPITSNIPVIMFTAKGQGMDVEQAAALGAVDYIVKPFTPIVLLEKIKQALNKAQK